MTSFASIPSASRAPVTPTGHPRVYPWAVLGAVVAAAGTAWLVHRGGAVGREAAFMAGIFALAAVLWVTEAIPLFATSLLVIGLQVLLLANPGQWPGLGFSSGESPDYRALIAVAFDPVLVLFFGGFVMAHAAVKEGVDRSMSARLLHPFGSEPGRVLLGHMVVTFVFSLWMSNTATTTMMLALAAPMLAAMPPGEPFRKAITLAIPFTANIGGMGTPVSSPPNAIALGYLRKAGYDVGFLDWMLVAVPLMVVLTAFAWVLLWRMYPPTTPGLRVSFAGGALSRRGRLVVGVFVVTVLLWMTERWHGVPNAIAALMPVVVLAGAGVFTRFDLAGVEWNVLILIAGGIALGTGMQMTGLDALIVGWLPTDGAGPLALTTAVVLTTVLIGTFMSNTAAANLLLPVGISAAVLVAPDRGGGGGARDSAGGEHRAGGVGIDGLAHQHAAQRHRACARRVHRGRDDPRRDTH